MLWAASIGGAAILLAAVLCLEGRRRERKVLREWALVLSPRAERLWRAMEAHHNAELALLDLTYARAREAREFNRIDEAVRLLDAGRRSIETYYPSMVRSLSAMAVLSRMKTAVAPVAPVHARQFRLWHVVRLAQLDRLLHYFLVSTSERFRLRVHLLARGFSAVCRVVSASMERLRAAPEGEPAWQQLDFARHDVRSLSRESLEAFRVLLMSLEADRRA